MEYLVFGGIGCSACENLKAWLESNGVGYTELDVIIDCEKAHEYAVRSIPTSIKLDGEKETGRISGFQLNEAKQFFGVK